MFDINEQLTYLVYVMQKRMRRRMARALEKYDVTLEQFVVLYNLVNEDGINQKTLSSRVDKDQATLARILDILENRGFVERRTTEKDRRAFLVYVTDAGREKVRDTARRLGTVHKEIIDGIPGGKVDEFIGLIKQMNTNLEKLSEK